MGGCQKRSYLPFERPPDESRRDERQQQEAQQQSADEEPVPSDPVVECGGIAKDRYLDRRAHGLRDPLHPTAELLLAEGEVARLAAGSELGSGADPLDRGGQKPSAAEHAQLEASQSAQTREEIRRVGAGDQKHTHAPPVDRQRRARMGHSAQ